MTTDVPPFGRDCLSTMRAGKANFRWLMGSRCCMRDRLAFKKVAETELPPTFMHREQWHGAYRTLHRSFWVSIVEVDTINAVEI